jgi:uncharacterized protein (DUF2126 family)/transglutaminase-like putative cysteine protease
MAIHVALRHRTHYTYDRLVALGPQVVRLRPAPHTRTRILSYSLRVQPQKHFINWQQDPQANHLARLVFPEKTRELLVEVDLVAEMAVFNPFDFFLEPEAERLPFAYPKELDHELWPYRLELPRTPRFEARLNAARAELDPGARPDRERPRTVDFLVDLNQRLWREISYVIRLEPGVQTPEETLEKGSGSCRDSAWLLCQLLRGLGLASRFVSGYLVQLTPDVKSLDGPNGPQSDFTDLHAWCEVYLPGAGWIGLDPTSGLLAGEGHIPLAATPDPQSAAPITGAVDECRSEFAVEMSVTRIFESPRVTRPYTEEQWRDMDRLGRQVDDDLKRYDCRLSMGGEPTFVSIDDMDGAEWNTVALGPTKAARADDLIRRLKRAFAPGAFLHYGQGKWYPGESLPRWAYGCYWRKDGEAAWREDSLLADVSRDHGFGERDAEEFILSLAERLGCGGKWIQPGFEDAWYYLWKERRLPVNVDPLDSNLKDEEERARLARIFERGLDRVVGFALPLSRQSRPGVPAAWVSGPWFFRPERMFLIPGDSPMGFRLPLESLPWTRPNDFPYLHPEDPMAPRKALPARQAFVRADRAAPTGPQRSGGGSFAGGGWDAGGAGAESPPARGESAANVIRTALCVEPRGGLLRVFMPPLATLEDYLDCVAAVEDTAAALDRPVILEGYTPPHDPRLNVLKVTPDPGVIEVNIHPAGSWEELVRNTETLYEEARHARLGTEKFMLDGRHTGTGGGNHIVLGGPTPADSPILRRPDLLRSLLAYWQNHPSLSFLFSGLFVGPTSQNPRVDEARNDSLYELEVAFRQAPDFGFTQPWLVDRLFRNLLIDASGNTHRAEFCIDKLYSPEGAAGRLGLLELRGFEMPPHPRMSLAQQLLLRTLVARFWKQPYENRIVRWGTEIHDRWMLPHFVWDDFTDVIEDLQSRGYPLRAEWFAPHFEFRFPQYGDVEARGIRLELRHALEPWHVLGEEPGAGGTVRFVDSSLERLQVKAQGLTPSRHVVTVGGVVIPLRPTGTQGEAVAGVRYRAWRPPECLHPTIGVHSPLVFDIVDTWNARSLGGCVYHVMHPGGRNYTTFPVNAYEAESRRLARFSRHGHSPGRQTPRQPDPNPDFPFTLDLRRV